MKAAIYARKSNDDDRSEDNKSITRQVEQAKAYAEAKGWSVAREHIYVDDGISGAEFKDRPGLRDMMGHLGEFDVVVMSELSRLGRDTWRNAVVIDDIRAHDVGVFYYLTDEEERAETPEQRIMVSLKSYASEVERTRTGERTRDTLSRKAALGYSAGGKCYGYRSFPVYGANGERLHSDFNIDDDEAEVIRGVFTMYADGYGYPAIAKTLNGDPRYKEQSQTYFAGTRVLPPVTKRSTGYWPSSSIRAMLHRRRYYGVIEYGRRKNITAGGSAKKRIKGDRIISVNRPDLRIIGTELWNRVQNRLKKVHARYSGHVNVNTHRKSKYLLSGLGQCGMCDGNMVVVGGQRHQHYYYGCSMHNNRGMMACSNNHRERLAILDDAVIGAVERAVLTPEALEYVVDRAVKIMEERRNKAPDRAHQVKQELAKLNIELDRFMTLIASGQAPERILDEIHRREERINDLNAELERLRADVPANFNDPRVLKALRAGARRFRALMYSDIAGAREALHDLIDGRIVFEPIVKAGRKTYALRGQTKVGPLLYNSGTEERT